MAGDIALRVPRGTPDRLWREVRVIYLVNRHYRVTVDAYLDSPRGAGMREHFQIVSYGDLPARRTLPLGTYVFSDLDRLPPAKMELATAVWEQLEAAGPGVRLMNRPGRAMLRYPLLCAMHARGINDFQARRATEDLSALRFPVFVREENNHTGSLTDLIPDAAALGRCLRRLKLLRGGAHMDRLLVVEFCDTSDAEGCFRKHSILRVGDRLFPRYLSRSHDWMIKAGSSKVDAAALDDEERFITTNPHADWAREVFEIAGIEYGRMDYGVRDGRPQVWEINTNPTVGPQRRSWRSRASSIPAELRNRRIQLRDPFHAEFRALIAELDLRYPHAGSVPIELDRELMRRVAWERRQAHVHRFVGLVRRRVTRVLFGRRIA